MRERSYWIAGDCVLKAHNPNPSCLKIQSTVKTFSPLAEYLVSWRACALSPDSYTVARCTGE